MSETETEIVEKPKKKRVNSKAKGSGFEGNISKILGEVLAPMKFRRSQSSGAILGGQNARFMDQFSADAKALFIGDVVPTNETDVARDEGWKFKFTLECKFYKTPDNIQHMFFNTKIKGWWEQAVKDAAKLGKQPLLIFKFNHTEIFAAANYETLDRLPVNLSRSMQLHFDDETPSMVLFLFKEALKDLDWWKDFQNKTPVAEPLTEVEITSVMTLLGAK